VQGILALGDRPTATAAFTAHALGLPYNSPQAVENCGSKLRQREMLRTKGVPVPAFFSFALAEDLQNVLSRVSFPCVVKPLHLSASQGVIRANNAGEFRAAVARIAKLLASPEVQVTREAELNRLLVEEYIPGAEIALEGVLERGELRILALFDKPDPLEGPYFEETIYVTPSRLAPEVQSRVFDCARQAVQALGLTEGPVHAEFRVNEKGPWVIEVAPRPIGGMCARALRFGPERMFLEELLVRGAMGLPGANLPRESLAAGVMMIPVPASGILQGVEGVEQAASTDGVDEVEITARVHDFIAAWPEGSSYLGFIFARGATAEEAEIGLRSAHSKLQFSIVPRLPVAHPVTGRTSP
jgi:biotin carboxylase